METFPSFRSTNLDFFGSDHRPVIIETNPPSHTIQGNQQHPLRFNHNWLLEEDYKEVCVNSWEASCVERDLPGILSSMADQIRKWANNRVGSLPKKIKTLHKHINDYWETVRGVKSGEEIARLEASLDKLQLKEEIYQK